MIQREDDKAPSAARAVRQPGPGRVGRMRRRSAGAGSGLGAGLLGVLALLCATVSMPGPALAQAAASLSRVGFVDIPYLLDRAPQALEAEQRLENEFAPRQAMLESQRAELASVAARLADSRLALSDRERLQLEIEARSLERRIDRTEEDFREELNIQKNTEFKMVRIVVLEAIAEFGRQNEYDLIVSDGVLFANPRIDVTERILENLQRESARLSSAN